MKNIRNLSLVWALMAALVVVSCGPSKEELQKKQIDELTSEIQSLDKMNASLESRMDSVVKEKQALAEQLAKDKNNPELKNKLAAANQAIAAIKAENVSLRKQVEAWQTKADTLAKKNEALQAKVSELGKKLEEAEVKFMASEQKAADLDNQLRTITETNAKTFFVSKFDITGVRKGEEDKKEKIRTNAEELHFRINLSRPKGAPVAAKTTVRMLINYPDGSLFFDEAVVVKNDAEHYVLPVKQKKMDLRKGKYTVKLYDGKNQVYDSFFLIVGVLG